MCSACELVYDGMEIAGSLCNDASSQCKEETWFSKMIALYSTYFTTARIANMPSASSETLTEVLVLSNQQPNKRQTLKQI